MSSLDLKLEGGQKAKLQALISTHLSKISTYTDDVLPEYVMVMVQNKKTATQVATDLNAFLGKSAGPFTDWLWETLQKFQQGEVVAASEISEKKDVEEPFESPKPTKKLASVIVPILPDEKDNNSRSIGKTDKSPRGGKERGRGERKFEKNDEVEEMEEEVSVASKRSVSSVIASPEVEKRPPVKDLNLTSRLVLNAVKQAVDDTKESKPIVNPKESPRKVFKPKPQVNDTDGVNVTITLEGNKISKKRGSWETEQDPSEEDKSKKAKQVRCQYWPNCKRGDSCIYHHPKDRCKNYPNCSFGNACLFIHPTSEIHCKFGGNCTRADCTFAHPPPNSSIPCRNGFACYLFNGTNCTYMHPLEACKFGDKCTKRPNCAFSHSTLCKRGSRCDRPGCTFAHSLISKPVRTSQTPCKFGVDCKNRETCIFNHPDDEVDTSALSDSLPKTPPQEQVEE